MDSIICKIPLSGRKGAGLFALVDKQDYDFLNGWKWSWKDGYAGRSASHSESLEHDNILRAKTIRMHRVILPCDAPLQIDHINGDKLDNRRCNLRAVTMHQNQMNRTQSCANTSGYRGVSRHKNLKKNPWVAKISLWGQKKTLHLGYFATPEEASAVYEAAALEMFGEYRRQ